MTDWFVEDTAANAIPVIVLTQKDFGPWQSAQSATVATWVAASGFEGKPATHCLIPDEAGNPACVLCGYDPDQPLWSWAGIRASLPQNIYRFDIATSSPLAGKDMELVALGWALGNYRFTRYRRDEGPGSAQLVWPEPCDRGRIGRLAEAIFLTRDLINTPANEMGPEDLYNAVGTVAKRYGAEIKQIVGDDSLPPREVDDNGTLFHFSKRLAPNKPLRLGYKRHRQHNEIGTRTHLIERNEFDINTRHPPRIGRSCIDQNIHPETMAYLHDVPADVAKADDAQRFAGELNRRRR